ncbi:MAG: hypothetical protein ACRENE_13115 [Polyangiaceae bacterium]
MASNTPKKGNRPMALLGNEKLVEGFTKHANEIPQLLIAGTAMKLADITAKVQARIAIAEAVATTHAPWQAAVKADKDATSEYREFFTALRQALLSAYAGKVDALADFGLTARKPPVITPQKRATAALKAKATREARGTMGKKQKAQIKPSVTVTPATVTVDKPATPASPTAPAAAPVPVAPAAPPVATVAAPVAMSPAPATTTTHS